MLVEDLDGLRLGLTTAADIKAVGEAADPVTARHVVAQEHPDVVVMSIEPVATRAMDST